MSTILKLNILLVLLIHVVLASQDPVRSLIPNLSSIGTSVTGCVGDVETIITSILSSTGIGATLLSPVTGLLNTVLSLVNQILGVVNDILSKL